MGTYCKPFKWIPHIWILVDFHYNAVREGLWFLFCIKKTQRRQLIANDTPVLHVSMSHSCTYDFQMYISSLNHFWNYRFAYPTACLTSPLGYPTGIPTLTCPKLSLWFIRLNMEPMTTPSIHSLNRLQTLRSFWLPNPSLDSSVNLLSRIWPFVTNSAMVTLPQLPFSLLLSHLLTGTICLPLPLSADSWYISFCDPGKTEGRWCCFFIPIPSHFTERKSNILLYPKGPTRSGSR